MNYWIFKCDRINKYDLDARLKNTEEDNTTWRVDRRYKDDVQPGDTAFIWQIGKDKGVRAIMRVTSKPHEMDEIESEKQYYRPSFEPKRMMRVTGKLLARFPAVSASSLKENDHSLPQDALELGKQPRDVGCLQAPLGAAKHGITGKACVLKRPNDGRTHRHIILRDQHHPLHMLVAH